MEIDDLQPSEKLTRNEIDEIKVYLNKNPKLKRRLISKNENYLITMIQPEFGFGLDKFRNDVANNHILEKAEDMIKSTSTNVYIGSCNAIKGLDYLRELGKIKKDFLYISGENDVGAPALAMEEMHHLTVNSKYVCIPGVAHVFNLEKPNETNKILSNFLN